MDMEVVDSNEEGSGFDIHQNAGQDVHLFLFLEKWQECYFSRKEGLWNHSNGRPECHFSNKQLDSRDRKSKYQILSAVIRLPMF